MDSLVQELIDKIINHTPREDMPASSLVARRWRRRSQQRDFEFVKLKFSDLPLWETNVPQHPDGIPSYAHHVRLKRASLLLETGILPRVLKTFTSIISLWIRGASLPLPDELVVPVSLGEFGSGVTHLTLICVFHEPFAGIKSLIFSLPTLKELIIHDTYPPSHNPPHRSAEGTAETARSTGDQWKTLPFPCRMESRIIPQAPVGSRR